MNIDLTQYKLPQVIGLVGPARHGKSSSAHMLGELGYVRLPMAAPLKNMLKAGFNLSDVDYSDAYKEKPNTNLGGKSPRQALQWLGTEWGRNLMGSNIWINAWWATRDAMDARFVVIDDIRFANEMALVHNLDGVLIEVHNPRVGYIKSNEHPSENEWAQNRHMVDWTVINDGDWDTLRARLEKALYGVSEKVETEAIN